MTCDMHEWKMTSNPQDPPAAFEWKKIKVEKNNNECLPDPNLNVLLNSPSRRKLSLPDKMHAIVQTSIPVAQIDCQTDSCENFDAACQTSKELSHCSSCVEKAYNRLQRKDASSQTDEILSFSGSNSTSKTCSAQAITSVSRAHCLSEQEDLELIVFQDVALIDLMIDRFYRYQLALLSNVRHSQIKNFLQSVLIAQIYGSMVNSIHTFLRQIISTTHHSSNINLISPTKVVNSVRSKQENICKSMEDSDELFANVIGRCFSAMQGAQAASMSHIQPPFMSPGSTSQPKYNLINFLNTTSYTQHRSYIPQSNYWRYGQNVSNNTVSSSTNSCDLPVLSVFDIREEFRREELRRNQCRY